AERAPEAPKRVLSLRLRELIQIHIRQLRPMHALENDDAVSRVAEGSFFHHQQRPRRRHIARRQRPRFLPRPRRASAAADLREVPNPRPPPAALYDDVDRPIGQDDLARQYVAARTAL